MSMYNTINGVNIAAFLIFPLLGFGRADDSKIPRFRDCFLNETNIEVLSRMGGGNRDCFCEDNVMKEGECNACKADKIEESDACISRKDDADDRTYCIFNFKFPEKWEKDIELIKETKFKETSKEYKDFIISNLKSEKGKNSISKLLGVE